MAEPRVPRLELPFFAADRTELRHGASVTKPDGTVPYMNKTVLDCQASCVREWMLRERAEGAQAGSST
jgi:hypothetical protein